MADFYVIYYALENSIRRLISGRLSEKHGVTWWKDKVPEGVQNEVAKKQKEEKIRQCPSALTTRSPIRTSASWSAFLTRTGLISPTRSGARRPCSKSSRSSTKSGTRSLTAAN